MNPIFIGSQWSTLCSSARSNASRLTLGVSPPAADLMQAESNRFCELDPPRDKDALELAYTQRMALSARLTAISRADAMARVHPEAAEEILGMVREFCDDDLPESSDAFLEMQLRNIDLTRSVAGICENDLAGRIGSRP